jgi:hypothetical protein
MAWTGTVKHTLEIVIDIDEYFDADDAEEGEGMAWEDFLTLCDDPHFLGSIVEIKVEADEAGAHRGGHDTVTDG